MLPTLLLLAACGGSSTEPAWALEWAQLTPAEDGSLSGFQVWELFSSGWDRRAGGDDELVCAFAQQLSGSPIPAPESCPVCEGAWELDLSPLSLEETSSGELASCDEALVEDPRFQGPGTFAVGELPEELVDTAPYPTFTLGWYAGGRPSELVELGYAYPLVLESGGTPSGHGWQVGETYLFWPAYAWQLEP